MATWVMGGWRHNFETILACHLLEHAGCKLRTVVALERFWNSIFCKYHFHLIHDGSGCEVVKLLDKRELGIVVDNYEKTQHGKRNMNLRDVLFLCICPANKHRICLHFSIPRCPPWICCKMFPLKDSGTVTRLPRSNSPSSIDMSFRRGQYGFSAGSIFFTLSAQPQIHPMAKGVTGRQLWPFLFLGDI